MPKLKAVQVKGTLVDGHKGSAVEVAFDPADVWGVRPVALRPGRRGFPVNVELNGRKFSSAIVSRMKRFFVLIDPALARQAGLEIGEHVRLRVSSNGR